MSLLSLLNNRLEAALVLFGKQGRVVARNLDHLDLQVIRNSWVSVRSCQQSHQGPGQIVRVRAPG